MKHLSDRNIPRTTQRRIREIISMHHQKRSSSTYDYENETIDSLWTDVQRQIYEEINTLFPHNPIDLKKESYRHINLFCTNALAVLVVSDWIASNETVYSDVNLSDFHSVETYKNHIKHQCLEFMKANHLNYTPIPNIYSFQDLFPYPHLINLKWG